MTKLYIITGSQRDQSFELEGDTILIGRAVDNDVQIMDSSVSRKHARVLKKGEKYFLEDLKSTNGTFFNGEILHPGTEVEVKEGLPITIGKVLISLGAPCSEDVIDVKDESKLPPELVETGAFTVYADRPRTSGKNLELIYNVSHVLIESLNLEEIFEKVLDYLFDLLKRIDRGAIFLVDEKTCEARQILARSKLDKSATSIDYNGKVVEKVIEDGKPVTVPTRTREQKDEVSENMGPIQSLLCVPLISRSKIRGAIYVDSIDLPHGFREEDIALLTALSSPAAVAIENALLYSHLEKTAEEKTASLHDSEMKCQACEARFKAVFDNISSGVVFYEVVDVGQDFVVVDLNSAAEKIEGVKKVNVVGKSVRKAFPVFEKAELAEMLQRVWETGKPERRTVTLGESGDVAGWRIYFMSRLPTGEIMAILDDVGEAAQDG